MFARSACGDTRARGQRCANDLGKNFFLGWGNECSIWTASARVIAKTDAHGVCTRVCRIMVMSCRCLLSSVMRREMRRGWRLRGTG